MLVLLLTMIILEALDPVSTSPRTGCTLRSHEVKAYSMEGDVMFGAIGPLKMEILPLVYTFTEPPSQMNCTSMYTEIYQCFLALAFATKEINQNPQILPNLTLGFKIVDSCYTESGALRGTLWQLSGYKDTLPNYRCQASHKMAAILGEAFSSGSVEMARILGRLNIPQISIKMVFVPSKIRKLKKESLSSLEELKASVGINGKRSRSKQIRASPETAISYASGLPSLKDKIQFPTFVRTNPSTEKMPYVLAQVVIHFGWTWVGIVASYVDYGLHAIQELKREFSENNICVAFLETIRLNTARGKIMSTVQTIKGSTAIVIILYAYPQELIPIMEELVAQRVTGKTWLVSPSLISSTLFFRRDLWSVLNGIIGLAIHSTDIPLFKEYQQQIRPSVSSEDIFIRPFWEHVFKCRWPESLVQINATYYGSIGGISLCTGMEQLETLPSSVYDRNNLRFSYTTYNAVYVFAHAIHNLLSCDPEKGKCSGLQDVQPWQLLHFVKNVHFTNPVGEEVYFDECGDSPHHFDIVNWQLAPDDSSNLVNVGKYDSRLPLGKQFIINVDRIVWGGGHSQVPHSVCSERCELGYREAAQEGKPVCCFDCILCPEGEISTMTGATNCLKCPEDQWSNMQRKQCVKKHFDFLRYDETLGMVLAVLSIFLALTTTAVFMIFFRFSETPIVRANNRTLSYITLLSLILCFLCPLLFIGRPEKRSCLLRQMVFGVIFTLCVSCILAKTTIVLLAFKANEPNSRYRSWLAVKIPSFIVLTGLCMQLILCVAWLLFSPPFLEYNLKDSMEKIILQCNENSQTAFYCMLGFLSLLACLSFVVAFKARKLPDRFNETKWITFSMMVFLSVWASFLPAYLSTKGKYMVAVEIFAILSSSAGVLGCIFFPKCFIILLNPDINRKKNFTTKMYSQAK